MASRSRQHLDLDLDLVCEKLCTSWTHYIYQLHSNWSNLVIVFHRSSLDLDLDLDGI